MKTFTYLFTFLIFSSTGLAQNQEETLQKIENAKIALITKRLDLTSEQAQQFWPIYNEYFERQKEIRSTFIDAKKGLNTATATEEQNKQLLELGLKVKEQQIQLERDYSNRMMNVISSRQMVELRKAESDFRQMLVERIRNQNMDRQDMRERTKNEERLRQQRNN